MGDYLRRYWMPIGGERVRHHRDQGDTAPGRDRALPDPGGRFGPLDRHCPHRRADLSYGSVEETGLRCNYHGWRMDAAGQVVEQPYDDTVIRARGRCTTRAYPVREVAGLLWAYGTAAGAELPSGSRSPGRTVFARSCSPTSP
jgi:5,5'-dehydrodivanillate O-demethylase